VIINDRNVRWRLLEDEAQAEDSLFGGVPSLAEDKPSGKVFSKMKVLIIIRILTSIQLLINTERQLMKGYYLLQTRLKHIK
jgi:hypothetical protein